MFLLNVDDEEKIHTLEKDKIALLEESKVILEK